MSKQTHTSNCFFRKSTRLLLTSISLTPVIALNCSATSSLNVLLSHDEIKEVFSPKTLSSYPHFLPTAVVKKVISETQSALDPDSSICESIGNIKGQIGGKNPSIKENVQAAMQSLDKILDEVSLLATVVGRPLDAEEDSQDMASLPKPMENPVQLVDKLILLSKNLSLLADTLNAVKAKMAKNTVVVDPSTPSLSETPVTREFFSKLVGSPDDYKAVYAEAFLIGLDNNEDRALNSTIAHPSLFSETNAQLNQQLLTLAAHALQLAFKAPIYKLEGNGASSQTPASIENLSLADLVHFILLHVEDHALSLEYAEVVVKNPHTRNLGGAVFQLMQDGWSKSLAYSEILSDYSTQKKSSDAVL